MLDPKFVRDNPQQVLDMMYIDRAMPYFDSLLLVAEFVGTDKEAKKAATQYQFVVGQQKLMEKAIREAKGVGTEGLVAWAKELRTWAAEEKETMTRLQNEATCALMQIPNMPHSSVPRPSAVPKPETGREWTSG